MKSTREPAAFEDPRQNNHKLVVNLISFLEEIDTKYYMYVPVLECLRIHTINPLNTGNMRGFNITLPPLPTT